MTPRIFSARVRRTVALGALILGATGCKDPLDNGRTEVRLAVISFHGDPVVAEVPDTVAVGTDATVRVRSYGGGCVDIARTDVVVDARVVEVRPYQNVHIPGPNGACTEQLKYLAHVATVRLTEAGIATVRIVGREQPGDQLITVERTVVVR